MSDAIIQVEQLGKRYRLQHQRSERYTALRDVLAGKASGLARRLRTLLTRRSSTNIAPSSTEDFWALRDVSFSIKRGEVVGIIGRNGAGKSTLLKILSRITEPTEGRVTISGRVASLLEVGTGFHPELTGRENIFLNGAILGMSRVEIKHKFDEIVAFAEVERFLDTPVKRYSSGMYVRLAFAVAAHLEPEILIVDEVLAVGDFAFQKKCLGKMHEVSSGGRTVLFVSHSMAAVQNLCAKGFLLNQGQLRREGAIMEVIKEYLNSSSAQTQSLLSGRPDRKGSGVVRFSGVTLCNADGLPVPVFACGANVIFRLQLQTSGHRPQRSVRASMGIDNDQGLRVLTLSTQYTGADFTEIAAGESNIYLRLPRLALTPGRYSYTLFVSVGSDIADWITNAGTFDVEDGDFYGTGHMPSSGPGQGQFLADHRFDLE